MEFNERGRERKRETATSLSSHLLNHPTHLLKKQINTPGFFSPFALNNLSRENRWFLNVEGEATEQ